MKTQSHADLLSEMKRSTQCHSGILPASSGIFIFCQQRPNIQWQLYFEL
jgi:hypothetical protein